LALHLTARTFAGATIIECSGRLVLGDESASLRTLVKSTLTESKRVVLELSDVVFIDSAGVGLLASLYTSAQMAGGALKLANLSPRMQDMLQITKLFVVFEVFDSAEDAAKSF
jgi:anti-sigma B factor antagonist